MQFLMSTQKTDKLAAVQQKVRDVTAVMQENIQNALERGEKIEDLEIKTKHLSDSAVLFHKNTKRLRCQMLRNLITQRCAVIALICAIIAVIIMVVVIMTCTHGGCMSS